MKKTTRLMKKLFSDTTSDEFKQKVMDGFDEAKETGDAIIEDDEEKLVLKSTDDGEVEITDADGEVTVAKESPEDETDIKLEPKEEEKAESEVTLDFEAIDADGNGVITKEEWLTAGMPEDAFAQIDADGNGVITKEEFEQFSQKVESETAPDVKVERVPGVDGEHIEHSAPNVEVTVETGITDEGKAGLKNYSVKFYGTHSYSQIYKISKAVNRAFSDCPACVTAESLEKAAKENLDNSEPTEEEKHYSEVADDIAHNATELAKAADDLEESQDPELAKEVKNLCDKMMSEIEKIEDEAEDKVDFEDVKSQCKKYAEAAEAVISKTEESKEDKPEEKEEKDADKDDDKSEDKEDKSEEEESKEDPEKVKKADEIAKKAEELQKDAEELAEDDEEGAEKLKTECDKLMSEIEEADADEDIEISDEVKGKVESFSKKAQEILNKTTRSFSESVYMKPTVIASGETKVFTKTSAKKTSMNPYLFK